MIRSSTRVGDPLSKGMSQVQVQLIAMLTRIESMSILPARVIAAGGPRLQLPHFGNSQQENHAQDLEGSTTEHPASRISYPTASNLRSAATGIDPRPSIKLCLVYVLEPHWRGEYVPINDLRQDFESGYATA